MDGARTHTARADGERKDAKRGRGTAHGVDVQMDPESEPARL